MKQTFGDQSNYEELFKGNTIFHLSVVVIGETNVGKTNLLSMLLVEKPPSQQLPTVGVQFMSKSFKLNDSRKAKVQLWDTAGQQRFRSLTMNHYKKASGVILVFDVSNATTFTRCSEELMRVRERASEDVQILLVGNKIDLPRRQVSSEQAQKFSVENQLLYAETSIHQLESIKSAFNLLIEEINRVKISKDLTFTSPNIKLAATPPEESQSCAC